ncbi:zinc finger CCCH domain-containing protein 10-like [Mobula birostris]|uniref:zinc finger CCCH domain-containing protein 10-like n=1 Tax=Mobula birostris TaxID=1983395 RepID=UPI003B27EC99
MPEKDNFTSSGDKGGSSSGDVCRDFLRNVCKRGKRCKFQHPEVIEASEPGASADELPLAKGEVPICRDYLNGDCQRGAKCKFRHVESELAGGSGGLYDPARPSMAAAHRFDPCTDLCDEYSGHLLKRRRLESMRFDLYDYGVPRPFPVDYRYLEEENLMLRKRVEELKKQASNLMATNEVLLEQNALYRNQPKVVTLANEQQLAPPTVAAVTAYNHTIVQAHNSLSSQTLPSRQELVPAASAVPPASAAPPPPGPHLAPELALAQTIAQSMAAPVSITQAIPGITVSHATTPMVSYAIASQSMRITPIPH